MTYLDELFSLHGKTALVTGGSSGIGFGIADALGRAGATVILVARGEPGLGQATELLASHGVAAAYVRADLARRSDIEALCEQVTREHDSLDILVNCAGINLRPPMDDLTDADWETTIAVNLTAPYRLGQFFGPRMAGQGWGRIINVGSQQSLSAFGQSGAYGVSKAGLAGLTRSQAEAWSSRGVCSNTIVPGFVVTPMTEAAAQAGLAEVYAARTTLGRIGVPADFAGAAVFLASAASVATTGQMLFVDGGFSVH